MSKFTDAVARGLKGLEAVSTGICPGCDTCCDEQRYDSLEVLQSAWEAGDVFSEPSFSSLGCDICGTNLGGNFECWHYIVPSESGGVVGQGIKHGDRACVDCIMYLANGDEPDSWGS